MTIRDLFKNWEVIATMVVRNRSTVLTLNGGTVPPNGAWFLRIVETTEEKRRAIEEAGYRLKDT
jgi:hypothetical protein